MEVAQLCGEREPAVRRLNAVEDGIAPEEALAGTARPDAAVDRVPPVEHPAGGRTEQAGERHEVHNVIVCTQCSCTAWPVLGLPPDWYKRPEYRSRVVREPRGVLHELGLDLPESIAIRVWDTTAETRYMVLPLRPAGTEGWSEERLAAIVTREAMIGIALVEIS